MDESWVFSLGDSLVNTKKNILFLCCIYIYFVKHVYHIVTFISVFHFIVYSLTSIYSTDSLYTDN
ncbi:hypothetical protein C1646_124051 [Rhizophagus diaphanus]|nr:hypothetical protein C1646_124051 [Rhizophagus diaphanus] [Rhizophagus sp. MUCL 43196]